jgi:hypothetical protein
VNAYGIDMFSNSTIGGFGGYVSSLSDGFTLWQTMNEGAGIHGDGNHLVLCSPGDADLVQFVDEDGAVLLSRIDGAGNYFVVSDQTLKQNVEPIRNSLNKLQGLTGYTYEYILRPEEIEKGNKPIVSAGFLAQDVIKVMPEAAEVNDQGNIMVNYSAIAPLLVESIKEQQQQIDSMKSDSEEQDKMKSTIEAQQRTIEELQKQIDELKELINK